MKQATWATAAEKHEDQEDEHHGGQDDANNAANAVTNFVDAVCNLGAAVRSALELAATAAIHLAGIVVGARAREEGGVVVDALFATS